MDSQQVLSEALKLNRAPGWMIKKAARGIYDARQTPLAYNNLCNDAATAKLTKEFIQRCLDGEFGLTQEEAEAWLATPEGKASLDKHTRPLKGAE